MNPILNLLPKILQKTPTNMPYGLQSQRILFLKPKMKNLQKCVFSWAVSQRFRARSSWAVSFDLPRKSKERQGKPKESASKSNGNATKPSEY